MKRFSVRLRLRAGSTRAQGFTLVETMVSVGVLVMVVAGSMYSFMVLNRYAGNLRNLSSAKELCQERVEQVNTMSFSPPSVTPLVPGQDGNYYILGMPSVLPAIPPGNTTMPTTVPSSSPQTTSDYNASGGFTGGSIAGGSSTVTLSEPVTIYATRDSTSGTTVTGTRTTTISLSPINDYTSATYIPTSSQSLNLVQFTVTVSYTYHGNAYSYSMYTLRGTD